MNIIKLFLAFLILPLAKHQSMGQQFNLINKVPIESPVDVASGPPGYIYIQTLNGHLVKFSLNGEEMQRNQLSGVKKPASIQAGQSLRLFGFYQAAQQFQYFDRLLTPSPLYDLPDEDNSFYSHASPSSDNGIWLWDASRLALKKYNPALDEINLTNSVHFYLKKDHNISQLQEYQNRVYLNDSQHEIMIFDLSGNYIQKLPVTNIEHFSFYRNELYWLKDGILYFYHLYNMRRRQMKLPGPDTAQFVVLAENYLYLLTEAEMWIYRILHH